MKDRECREGNSIYVWRIVFTVLIMILHYNSIYTKIYENPHVTNGWYISVEFFFIVSGYLLMARAEIKGRTESALRYTARRYIKLYPEYLFTLTLTWIIKLCADMAGGGIEESLQLLLKNWEDLFMLQGIGLNRRPFQYATWYISVMLIAGFLIYHCVTCYRETYIKFILPVLLTVIYSYLYRRNAGLDHWRYTDGIWMNEAVLRGMLDMNVGVAVYMIHKRAEQIKWTKLSRYLMLMGEVLSYGFVIIMSLRHGGKYDFLLLFVLGFSVLLSFMNSFFRIFYACKGLRYLNELCYAAYLNHNIWNAWIMPRFFPTDEWHVSWVVLYVLFVFVYAAVTHWWVKKVVQFIKYAGSRYICHGTLS